MLLSQIFKNTIRLFKEKIRGSSFWARHSYSIQDILHLICTECNLFFPALKAPEGITRIIGSLISTSNGPTL